MRLQSGITTFLLILLLAGCTLIDGNNGDKEILLRISNQTGYDYSWLRMRINIGPKDVSETFEYEYDGLINGEDTEYEKIPVDPNLIDGYTIRTTVFSEEIGFKLDFFLNSQLDTNRAIPIASGRYTYLLEFLPYDFVHYTISQDEETEEGVRIRVRNAGEQDYEQVSVWLRDEEDPFGREFAIGALAAGQISGYEMVEGALQFTRIRVVTAGGDTLDNEPLTHFGTDLPPGDYTYHVEIRIDELHDNSRIVKD